MDEGRKDVQRITSPRQEVYADMLRIFEQRVEELQHQVSQDPTEQQELLSQTLVELQVSVEELRVAEEELRQQNEELIIAHQTLEAERERYLDLFEFAPDGYFVTDIAGIVQEANRAAAVLLGMSQKMLIGKPLAIYLTREDHAAFYALLQPLARGEEIHEWQMHLQPRNREKVPVSMTATSIQDRHGNVTGVRWLFRDITIQTEVRKELRVLNVELEARVQQRTAELRRSNDELQQFAYSVSHDLQEPLRAVSIYVQLLAERYRGHFDSEADEFIGYAIEGTKRMHQLIHDLLDYSRVHTKEQAPTEINCEDVVSRVLKSFDLHESNAVVTYDPLPIVVADGTQLHQLFQNLLSNALKFHGPEPPRVHISAQPREHEWLFSVRDNGIGLDPAQAERIFVIFQRLHTTREYPGTGIGLALCQKIIRRHGGRIWVESEPGKGATFYFTLPAKP